VTHRQLALAGFPHHTSPHYSKLAVPFGKSELVAFKRVGLGGTSDDLCQKHSICAREVSAGSRLCFDHACQDSGFQRETVISVRTSLIGLRHICMWRVGRGCTLTVSGTGVASRSTALSSVGTNWQAAAPKCGMLGQIGKQQPQNVGCCKSAANSMRILECCGMCMEEGDASSTPSCISKGIQRPPHLQRSPCHNP
jgi:hypothetical protein